MYVSLKFIKSPLLWDKTLIKVSLTLILLHRLYHTVAIFKHKDNKADRQTDYYIFECMCFYTYKYIVIVLVCAWVYVRISIACSSNMAKFSSKFYAEINKSVYKFIKTLLFFSYSFFLPFLFLLCYILITVFTLFCVIWSVIISCINPTVLEKTDVPTLLCKCLSRKWMIFPKL